ncbi:MULTISPECIES: antitoxin [Streptomyces]|uniref:antitoxin n=1 Tax=Streptomyces TaxID=1883 RepID=UPI0004C4C4A9|nr:antitoxin [Streptomyces sp. NRRL S-237]
MSMFDKLKDLIKGHPDQARQGVEKAGDAFDAKTQDKYRSQVDTAQQKLNEQIGKEPPAPGQTPRPPQP